EIGSAALFDLESERGVERLLAGTTDPEIAFPGLTHFDHPLFHGPAADHDAEDLKAALNRQRLRAAGEDRLGQRCRAVAVRAGLTAEHAASSTREIGRSSLGMRPVGR